MRTSKVKVCVTGGGGFIASHIIQQLLEKGSYTVVATVRDPYNMTKYGHLLNLPGAENLTLIKADLLDQGSFTEAFRGCVCIFHTASPFFVPSNEKNKALYKKESFMPQALGGTLNVLRSAEKETSVRCVIVCASTANIYCRTGLPDDHVYTEEDWSNREALLENKEWYALSKVEAELAAIEFAKKAHFRLAVMHPTLVWGPVLSSRLGQSSTALLGYMDGSRTAYAVGNKAIVDVRDVARAHILAFEDSKVTGRLMLIGAAPTWKELCLHLRNNVGFGDKVPMKQSNAPSGFSVPTFVKFDNSKAVKLIGTFTDWRETVNASAKSFIDWGHIPFPKSKL